MISTRPPYRRPPRYPRQAGRATGRGRSANPHRPLAPLLLTAVVAGLGGLLMVAAGLVGQTLVRWVAGTQPVVGAAGFQRPAGLDAASCVVVRGTPGGRHRLVAIDPGHGGLDPGAAGTTSDGSSLLEKTTDLAVARELAADLMSDGYAVVLTRATDTNVAQLSPVEVSGGAMTPQGSRHEIQARLDCVNAARADVLVAIHFNSFGDPSAGGAQTFFDDVRPFSADNQRLAIALQQHLIAALSGTGWTVPDRGILADSQLSGPGISNEGAIYGHLVQLGPAQAGWVDRPSAMPGALVEPLFLTRPSEADVAASPEGQRAMADGLRAGLEQFLGRG